MSNFTIEPDKPVAKTQLSEPEVKPKKSPKPAKKVKASKKPKPAKKAPDEPATERSNKKAEVIVMMKLAKGVTLAEIVEATGWQKHTTGLVLGTNGDRNSDWFKITKAVGASDKHAGKLGSFGIGKHAPFACSDLRTVFYGTKDRDGATAFQGVSKLVSYKLGKEVTQGTGYFGVRNGNKPLLNFGAVPLFERKRTGADIYVVGFHHYPDWEARVIKSVIESFFVAIHFGRLIVKVGKTVVNSTNLRDHIHKHYAEPEPHYFADEYYEALTNEEDAVIYSDDDFWRQGAIKLCVLENKNFKKKVAMLRRNGMKIFDKGHFPTPLRFAGVFTVEGPKLDALLRTLEPPSHNAWEPERGEDPAEANASSTTSRVGSMRKSANWFRQRT